MASMVTNRISVFAPALPGWAGSLDLVVVLAPEGADAGAASAIAEANRRGCQLVVACQPRSMVAEHAEGRYTSVLPVSTGDQLATAVVMLGKAVHALQEVGVVPLRPVPFVRVDLLGVFPDLFSLGAQGLLIAAPFIVRTLRRTPSADSAAAA